MSVHLQMRKLRLREVQHMSEARLKPGLTLNCFSDFRSLCLPALTRIIKIISLLLLAYLCIGLVEYIPVICCRITIMIPEMNLSLLPSIIHAVTLTLH